MTSTASKPFTPMQERMLSAGSILLSRVTSWLYRMTGGAVGGRWMYGAPVMLLSVKGRKTGQWRTAPLLYLRDGSQLVTVASKAGSAAHPKWFLNLEAHPECEVEIGREKRRMRARRATAGEKTRYWPQLVAMYPAYDSYQRRTARDIPVVILTPTSTGPG